MTDSNLDPKAAAEVVSFYNQLLKAYTEQGEELEKVSDEGSRLRIIGVQDGIVLALSLFLGMDKKTTEEVLKEDVLYEAEVRVMRNTRSYITD
jgi:hypothetical protein